MERYHDTRNDPVPLHSAAHENERARLIELTQAFLANGGKVQRVGFQMSDAATPFVINAKHSPVYAHLFTTSNTLH